MVHLKSDGNGGYNISKGFISFITLLCTIAPLFAFAISFQVGLNSRVYYLEEKQTNINEKIDIMQSDVRTLSQNTAIINTKLVGIQEDITEIKQEMKQYQHT